MAGKDYSTAAKLRDTIRGIVQAEITKIMPPPRIGQVKFIDRLNNEIQVIFPGDDTYLTVKMTPGVQPQSAMDDNEDGTAPADLVRVGGRMGAYYLMDVITSSARNLMYDQKIEAVEAEVLSDNIAPEASPEPVIYSGIGAAVVDFAPLEIGEASPIANPDPCKYELHASAVDNVEPSTGTLVTIDAVPPIWVRQMPGTSTALSYEEDTYFCLIAYDKDGPAPRSPWVAGKPKKAGDGDVVLSVETLLANNALVEALKAVDADFSGNVTANTLTGTGKASFRTEVELGPGAKMKMQKATTAPTTPPSVTQFVPSTDVTARAWGSGGYYAAGYFYTCHTDGKIMRQADTPGAVAELAVDVKAINGVIPMTVALLSDGTRVVYGFISGGPLAGIYAFQLWSEDWDPMGGFFYPTVGGQRAIAGDGTNIVSVRKNGSNEFVFETYDPASSGSTAALSTFTSNYTEASGAIRTLNVGNFDLGVKIYIVGSSASTFRTFNTSGVRQSGYEWEGAVSEVCALGWDGTRFLHLTQTAGKVYRYDTTQWTITGRSTAWALGTWINDTGTPYETNMGKEVTYTAKKRWRAKFTFSADIPSSANKVGVYFGSGIPKPTQTGYVRLGTSTTKVFELADMAATPNGVNPPAANNFPGATPSAVESPDGDYFFNADGDIQTRWLKIGTGMTITTKETKFIRVVAFNASGVGSFAHNLGEIPHVVQFSLVSHTGQVNSLHTEQGMWDASNVDFILRDAAGNIFPNVSRTICLTATVK